MAQQGKTDAEIALAMGIAERTLRHWKNVKGGFSPALQVSRDVADRAVEAALYASATGFEREQVKIAFDKERGEFVTERILIKDPPNPTSLQFWLRNRKVKNWNKAVDKTEHSGSLSLEEAVAQSKEIDDKKG